MPCRSSMGPATCLFSCFYLILFFVQQNTRGMTSPRYSRSNYGTISLKLQQMLGSHLRGNHFGPVLLEPEHSSALSSSYTCPLSACLPFLHHTFLFCYTVIKTPLKRMLFSLRNSTYCGVYARSIQHLKLGYILPHGCPVRYLGSSSLESTFSLFPILCYFFLR